MNTRAGQRSRNMQNFNYTPPDLTESELKEIQSKYKSDGFEDIYDRRIPSELRLFPKIIDDVNISVIYRTKDAMEILKHKLHVEAYDYIFCLEWLVMSECANWRLSYPSPSAITEYQFTHKKPGEIAHEFENHTSFNRLQDEYCYKWLAKFDHPDSLVDIKKDIVKRYDNHSAVGTIDVLINRRSDDPDSCMLQYNQALAITRGILSEDIESPLSRIVDVLYKEVHQRRKSKKTSCSSSCGD